MSDKRHWNINICMQHYFQLTQFGLFKYNQGGTKYSLQDIVLDTLLIYISVHVQI